MLSLYGNGSWESHWKRIDKRGSEQFSRSLMSEAAPMTAHKRSLMAGVTERCEVQAGAGEELVEESGRIARRVRRFMPTAPRPGYVFSPTHRVRCRQRRG